jgi:hypothetical protein
VFPALPLRSPVNVVRRQAACASTVWTNAVQWSDREPARESGSGLAKEGVKVEFKCHNEIHFV